MYVCIYDKIVIAIHINKYVNFNVHMDIQIRITYQICIFID